MLIGLDIYWKDFRARPRGSSAARFDGKEPVAKLSESKADLPPGVTGQNTKSLRQ